MKIWLAVLVAFGVGVGAGLIVKKTLDQFQKPQQHLTKLLPTSVTSEKANSREQSSNSQQKTSVAEANGQCPATDASSSLIKQTSSKSASITQTSEECLRDLRPSQLVAWQQAWNKRVSEFKSDDPHLFNGRKTRLSPEIVSDFQGTYVATFETTSALETELVRVRIEFQIPPLKEKFNYKWTITNFDGTIRPEKCAINGGIDGFMGTDIASHSAQLIFENCFESNWPEIIAFAIKLPTTLAVGESSVVPFYITNDQLKWQPYKTLTVLRQK